MEGRQLRGFVVTSVSRTAGCLQGEEVEEEEVEEKKIHSLICSGARLHHSFAAADPNPVIKTDQSLITPGFYLFIFSPPPMAEQSTL